ncbi:hypothetical protein BIY23_03700 [Wolbachia pipientis]|uniref:Uncharacterized protein n=1 Tax=Wolbachia pipientis TaxID=955 RepID=A0A1E7QJ49_WOLPI|nr:histidine phosphotransferase family protein [Wolbachia pipientis]OEY86502.1 hypothetical protein BIY23_03700 [Wolbachia pipientis]
MNENATDILLTIELFSSRMFHDFANSMSGVIFGIEELEFGDTSTRKEALFLIKESFNDLLAKYKIMKQAYSISDSNSCFSQTRSNIENYLLQKKIKLVWDIIGCNTQIDVIEKTNKIIASIILTVSVAIAGIHEISIVLSNDMQDKMLLIIKVHSQFSKSFADKLNNKNKIDLDTKNINIYLTLLLLKCYNAEINFTHKDSSLEVTITI